MAREKYVKLLKEVLTEWTDIPNIVDVKGPMIDPILGFDGRGELKTTTASGILERYYFKEQDDEGDTISAVDGVDNEQPPNPPSEEMDDLEKELTMDSPDDEFFDAEEVETDPKGEFEENVKLTKINFLKHLLEDEDAEEEKEDEDEEKEDKDEEKKETEDEEVTAENYILKKLIREMEEDDTKEDKEGEEDLDIDEEVDNIDDDEDKETEEVKEGNFMPGFKRSKEEGLEEAFSIFKKEIEE